MNLLETVTIELSLPGWVWVMGVSVLFTVQMLSLFLGYKRAKLARDKFREVQKVNKRRDQLGAEALQYFSQKRDQ